MEARPEGIGDSTFVETEDRKREREAKERERDESKDRDKKVKEKTSKKESDSPQGVKKISFTEARLIAQAVEEAKALKVINIGKNQIEILERLVQKYGIELPKKPIGDYTPKDVKNMLLAIHQVYKKAQVEEATDFDYRYTTEEGRREEKKNVIDVQMATIAKTQKLTLEAGDFEVEIHEHFEVSKGAGAGEGDFEADKDTLYENLPDENAVAEPLKHYVRELKVLKDKEWRDSGQVYFEQTKNLANQLIDDIKNGVIDRADPNLGSIRTTLENVSRQLSTIARTAEYARMAGKEKNFYPTKKKITDNLKLLTEEAMVEGSDEYNRLKGEIQAEIDKAKVEDSKNYKQIFEVVAAVKEADQIYKGTGDSVYQKFRRIFDAEDFRVLTSDDENVNLLERKNKQLRNEWRNMSDAEQLAIAGDIESAADLYGPAILSGWRTMEDAESDLFNRIANKEDKRGFRMWRATEAIRGIETTIRESEKTRVPASPVDITERLTNVFRKAEAAGLSTEDLGPILNEGLALVRAMPSTTERERKRREDLIHRLESFRAIHVMLINLEKGDMNPEKVMQTFSELWEGREEITLENFLTRYEEDDRGREFRFIRRDKEGNEIKDAEGKPESDIANLFDEEFRLYSQRLRDERIKMNMVEEMTKHDLVEGKYSASDISEMMKGAGFDPEKPPKEYGQDTEDAKTRWIREVNELREYFISKMPGLQEKIDKDLKENGNKSKYANHRRAEDLWGLAEFTSDIKPLIEEWHKTKTLHGAMGVVDSEAAALDLAIEFGDIPQIAGLSGEEKKAAIEKVKRIYFGRQYLDVRRSKLVEDFKRDLEDRGLSVNRNFSWKEDKVDLEKADIHGELSEKGYFESLDNTAYRMAWVMMWSNYDNIRIYSKDKKHILNGVELHDAYEGIVFHSSTSIFAARGIDHMWEFFHTDNENRGRAKHNETNEIWKQFLPGKHHYLFPQNTMLVRWSRHFMTPEQNAEVDRRILEYQAKYDFHNPGREGREGYEDEYQDWMRSAVVMDMVENGEFFLGQEGFGMTDLAKRKKLKKFEFIDVYTDRGRVNNYISTGELQNYLANPTEEKFIELNKKDKFYSTRSARQFPWMALAMRAHWEIAGKHYKRLFDKDNWQSASMENMVNKLVASGDVEKEQGVEFKRKNLGFVRISPHGDPDNLVNAPTIGFDTRSIIFGNTFFRRTRQTLEFFRKTAWEYKWQGFGLFPIIFGAIGGLLGDIAKRLPKYTSTGENR